ncbi:MAG: response regulator [Planctomycetota bacterium]
MQREFTVGEIARIINVVRSTVITWIREERIAAYQLPGGGNRVTYENLVAFMRAAGIPLDFLADYTRTRVLIADDDRDLLELLRRGFANDRDFVLRTAETAFQTGIIAGEFAPHAVALDVNLCDMDGRDVCLTLRARPQLKGVLIVGISGVLEPAAQKDLKRQGFDAFLGKPFAVNELKDLIKGLIRGSDLRPATCHLRPITSCGLCGRVQLLCRMIS